MQITLAPGDESYIKHLVDEGVCRDAEEFIQRAIRRLRKEQSEQEARLMAALEEGDKAIREGRTVPYTPDFLDRCEKRAMENLANGAEIDPDVLP